MLYTIYVIILVVKYLFTLFEDLKLMAGPDKILNSIITIFYNNMLSILWYS